MKSNAVIRIILFSIAILVLLSILGIGLAADFLSIDLDFPFSEVDGIASSTGTADADTVRRLSIEWAAGTITIRPGEVNEINFTETGDTEDDPMVWLQSGDTLKIASVKDESFFHVGSIPSKDLLIEVPQDWNCTDLEIDTAAADLMVDSLTIGKVDFDGASGVFDFRGCTVDSMDLDTASGDITFTGSLNSLECDAASADCEIALLNCPGRIEMDMVSGNVNLILPENCGFTATLDALSGRLDSDFEITRSGSSLISGDGSCCIDISAMSGDVYIRKQQSTQ